MGAYINGDYKSEYSGDQIDAAIGKVRTPDSTPTASSDNLVTSGGVKAALDQKQAVINDLSTIRQGASDGTAALTATNEIEQVMAQGYKYYGVATPNTNPGTLEQKVFYIASQPGTYTNLGGIVVNEGEVCTLMWNETSWSKQVTGAATATQVSQLGQEINGISEKTYNMSDGAYGYVNYSDGGVVDRTSAQDYYMLKVSVQPGYEFTYGLQGPTVSAIIAAYDIEGNYLQGKSVQGTAAQATGTYIVEDGVSFLRFSCGRYTTSSLKRVAKNGLTDEVNELQENLQQVAEDVDGIDTELDGYSGQDYDMTTGEYAYVAYSGGGVYPRTTAQDYYMLEVQDVKIGQIFKYSLSASNVCAIVAAYDADGNYLQSKSVQGVTSTTVTGNYVVQSGVKFLRFTTSAGSIPYGVGLSLLEKRGLTERVSVLEESVTPQDYPFAGVKLSELTLNASATRNIDGTISLSNGGKAYWETPTVAVAYTLAAKFVYHTGLYFSIGKDASSYGGRFVLRDGYIDYYAYSLTDGTYNHTTYETGITLVDGEKYSIFVHRIQNYETGGRTVEIEINGEYNEHFESELDAGPWYGRPFVQADSASSVVVDFNFAMHLDFDLRNAVIGVWGHSYVEADSLGANRMKSFTNLLGGVFGYDKLFNFGWGGDYAQRCLQRIQGESRFTRAIKYALIVIGANDAGNPVATTTGYMTQMAEYLIGIGITPVFATPNPIPAFDSTANQVLEDISDWIKSSGYKYFDMRQVFLDANGDVRTGLYLADDTHPTVEGHQLIFNRIKMDCPYLF